MEFVAAADAAISNVIRHCIYVVPNRVVRNVALRDRSARIPKREFALCRDRGYRVGTFFVGLAKSVVAHFVP